MSIIATHSGMFHADEVTAVALLAEFYYDEYAYQILRTRDEEEIDNADIVVDVGGVLDSVNRRFDHHQVSYTGSKSSAGLVLDFLEANCMLGYKQGLADFYRGCFIDGIDAVDNGYAPKLEKGYMDLSSFISSFNHKDMFSEAQDARFKEAVIEVRGLLSRLKARYEKNLKDEKALKVAIFMCDTEILELPYFMSWAKLVNRSSKAITRVIWPQETETGDTEWRVQVPNTEPGSFDLAGAPLRDPGNISDLVFVHKSGFIGAAVSRDSAYKLAGDDSPYPGEQCFECNETKNLSTYRKEVWCEQHNPRRRR